MLPAMLLVFANRSSIDWWKREQRQGSALSMFGELLHLLHVPELRTRASALATLLLHETGLFEGCEWEIPCWFYPLCGDDSSDAASAIGVEGDGDVRTIPRDSEEERAQRLFEGVEFLDAILKEARQKLLPLTDSVAEAMCQCNPATEEGQPPELPEGFRGRFSIVTLAALQRLNSGTKPSVVKWAAKSAGARAYATGAISAVVRCHRDPCPLAWTLLREAVAPAETEKGAEGQNEEMVAVAPERTRLLALAHSVCQHSLLHRSDEGGGAVSTVQAAMAAAAPHLEQQQRQESAVAANPSQASTMTAPARELQYIAVAPGVIRAGVALDSDKLGKLKVGQEITVTERVGTRVKFEGGWMSLETSTGKEILSPVVPEPVAQSLDALLRRMMLELEPETETTMSVGVLVKTVESMPSSYWRMAVNCLLFQINALLGDSVDSTAPAWSEMTAGGKRLACVQTLFHAAQQVLQKIIRDETEEDSDQRNSTEDCSSSLLAMVTVDRCVELAFRSAKNLLASKASAQAEAARALLFEATTLALCAGVESGDGEAAAVVGGTSRHRVDIRGLLAAELREECASSDDNGSDKAATCTILVSMFQRQWSSTTLFAFVGELFAAYESGAAAESHRSDSGTQSTQAWALLSFLQLWAAQASPTPLPHNCLQTLTSLLMRHKDSRQQHLAAVEEMTVIVLKKCLTTTTANLSSVNTWPLLTPGFLRACWLHAGESTHRRELTTMLLRYCPLHRQLFLAQLFSEHDVELTDGKPFSSSAWTMLRLHPNAASVTNFLETQSTTKGSPLTLVSLLSCTAVAIDCCSDAELTEYLPTLMELYAPLLVALIGAATQQTDSGNVAMLASENSSDTVTGLVQAYLLHQGSSDSQTQQNIRELGSSATRLVSRIVSHEAAVLCSAELSELAISLLCLEQPRTGDSTRCVLLPDQLHLVKILLQWDHGLSGAAPTQRLSPETKLKALSVCLETALLDVEWDVAMEVSTATSQEQSQQLVLGALVAGLGKPEHDDDDDDGDDDAYEEQECYTTMFIAKCGQLVQLLLQHQLHSTAAMQCVHVLIQRFAPSEADVQQQAEKAKEKAKKKATLKPKSAASSMMFGFGGDEDEDKYSDEEDVLEVTVFPNATTLVGWIVNHPKFTELCLATDVSSSSSAKANSMASRVEVLELLGGIGNVALAEWNVATAVAKDKAKYSKQGVGISASFKELKEQNVEANQVAPFALTPEVLVLFLAGYTVSCSPADAALLRLFQIYERSGLPPRVAWGASAHNVACHPDVAEVTAFAALMDSAEYVQMLTNTLNTAAANFGIDDDGFEGEEGARPVTIPARGRPSHRHNVRFLLPFCDALVQADTISARKCIDVGCAGYILATLGAAALSTRQLAYHATARLLDKITEDASFAHRFQVMALLHAVRTAITEEYQRIPHLMTSFIRAALPVLVRPEHALYEQINRFILVRPTFNLTEAPMFYSMFNSGSAKDYKTERAWILNVLLHGVSDSGLDLQIFQKKHIFEILMTYFDAPFADAFTCRMVIQILERACSIPEFLVAVVERHALVAWLVRLVSVERVATSSASDESTSAKPDSANRGGRWQRGKGDDTGSGSHQNHAVSILGTVLRLLRSVHAAYYHPPVSRRRPQRMQEQYVDLQFTPVVEACCSVLPSRSWSDDELWRKEVVIPGLRLLLTFLGSEHQVEDVDDDAFLTSSRRPQLVSATALRTLIQAATCEPSTDQKQGVVEDSHEGDTGSAGSMATVQLLLFGVVCRSVVEIRAPNAIAATPSSTPSLESATTLEMTCMLLAGVWTDVLKYAIGLAGTMPSSADSRSGNSVAGQCRALARCAMQWCIISHGSRGSGDGAGAPATACATLLLSPDRALLPALLSKCSVVLAASAHDITADEHTQECSESDASVANSTAPVSAEAAVAAGVCHTNTLLLLLLFQWHNTQSVSHPCARHTAVLVRAL
eukprot:COSAG05_NODE_357_length_10830_cov_5.181810_8_plen_1956_part_00